MRIKNRKMISREHLQPDVQYFGVSGTPRVRALEEQSEDQLYRRLVENSDIQRSLEAVGLGFSSRIINVLPASGGNPPVEIIPSSQYPTGYIIINPAEVSGGASEVTFFPSATRTTAGSPYTSPTFNSLGFERLALFLNISANVLAPTIDIDIDTLDPLSGNFAEAQSDIFGSPSAVGTYYASIGPLGVDKNIRARATLTGGTSSTFSLSGLFKGGLITPVGSTVYIGGPDVNTTYGYPVLAGDKEYFYLEQDVNFFAITATESLVLKVFRLR